MYNRKYYRRISCNLHFDDVRTLRIIERGESRDAIDKLVGLVTGGSCKRSLNVITIPLQKGRPVACNLANCADKQSFDTIDTSSINITSTDRKPPDSLSNEYIVIAK